MIPDGELAPARNTLAAVVGAGFPDPLTQIGDMSALPRQCDFPGHCPVMVTMPPARGICACAFLIAVIRQVAITFTSRCAHRASTSTLIRHRHRRLRHHDILRSMG